MVVVVFFLFFEGVYGNFVEGDGVDVEYDDGDVSF